MGLRITLTVSEEYTERAQSIGMIVLSYIDQKMGLRPYCTRYREDHREHIVISGETAEETRRIWDGLHVGKGRGIFEDVDLRDSYHYRGRAMAQANGNIWHDRLYDVTDSIVRYFIDQHKTITGHIDEISEIVRALYPVG